MIDLPVSAFENIFVLTILMKTGKVSFFHVKLFSEMLFNYFMIYMFILKMYLIYINLYSM